VVTVGLVHGAYHGGSCWAKLVPELGRLGLQVRTVDLPSHHSDAGAQRYAETVVSAFGDVRNDLVLVGHSVGGLTIPLVAQTRPVSRLIFLCSLLPDPGCSLRDQMARENMEPNAVSDAKWLDMGDGTWLPSPETARALFYHDLAEEDANWLLPQLRRQSTTPINEVTPLQNWPDTPRSAIICRDDRVVSPEWARQAYRARLGIDPIELDGGHSPFAGRPVELARAIAGLI
jgi:pimeloyl-ACP methyl ester carboxylesterase